MRPAPRRRSARARTGRNSTCGYDCALGEGISRDPLGEEGGRNLYCYVANNACGDMDLLGLQKIRKDDEIPFYWKGKKMGTVKVDFYELVSHTSSVSWNNTGATLNMSVHYTEAAYDCNLTFRWRQHITWKGQDGTVLKFEGKEANNLLDPSMEPPHDDKEWYYDVGVGHFACSRGDLTFFDKPNWPRSNFKSYPSVSEGTFDFELELVGVETINEKLIGPQEIGHVVLTIDWGFVADAGPDGKKDALIQRDEAKPPDPKAPAPELDAQKYL